MMFFDALLKECKQVFRNVIYYVIIFCFAFFFAGQVVDEIVIVERPEMEDNSNYGYTYSNDEEIIMEMTIIELAKEYNANLFTTYPYGLRKQISLNDAKKKRIETVFEKITGMSIEQIQKKIAAYYDGIESIENGSGYIIKEKNPLNIKPTEALTYGEFMDYMDELNTIIGNGSKYSLSNLKYNARVHMGYEDAKLEYDEILYKDKISGAYARVFCDYMQLMLALFPVFLAVSRVIQDKKSRAFDVIYTKNISSFKLISTRYIAINLMIFLPVIIFSLYPLIKAQIWGGSVGVHIDVIKYFLTICGWLIPTLLFSTSVGFVFTILTDTPIALVIMGMGWFVTLFLSTDNLIGNIRLNLMPRFNAFGKYQIYKSIFIDLIINRIYYAILSCILIILAVLIYKYKRKGKLIWNGNIFTNRKIQFED